MNLLGKHNILNATASICLGILLQIPINQIKRSLINFQGVKRRFTFLGKINKSSIYDDYAHHPTEIKATYEIAKYLRKKNIIVVFQPHRFSRTKDLYSDFIQGLKKIDILDIFDIYRAGEKPIKGVESNLLVKDLLKNKSKEVYYLSKTTSIDSKLSKYYEQENLIIFMGAGSISQWAHDLLKKHHDKKI